MAGPDGPANRDGRDFRRLSCRKSPEKDIRCGTRRGPSAGSTYRRVDQQAEWGRRSIGCASLAASAPGLRGSGLLFVLLPLCGFRLFGDFLLLRFGLVLLAFLLAHGGDSFPPSCAAFRSRSEYRSSGPFADYLPASASLPPCTIPLRKGSVQSAHRSASAEVFRTMPRTTDYLPVLTSPTSVPCDCQ